MFLGAPGCLGGKTLKAILARGGQTAFDGRAHPDGLDTFRPCTCQVPLGLIKRTTRQTPDFPDPTAFSVWKAAKPSNLVG